MSFYLKPPRGVIPLSKLETCVQQRLNFYNIETIDTLEFNNCDCLVEDTGLDRTGHYMLRLYAHSRPTFSYKFIKGEQKLLEVRLNSYEQSDSRMFLKRLQKHCQELLKEHLSKDIEQFCIFIDSLATEILKPECLRHIFSSWHIQRSDCSEIFFSVPFKFCYSLIGNREYNLSLGKVEIDCKNWKKLLVSVYGIFLKVLLRKMKENANVENALNDSRVEEVLKSIKDNNYSQYKWKKNFKWFDMRTMQQESRCFPLCMASLFMSLKKTNRLSHNDRFDFSLFMKGIGVTVSDSLKFWEGFYSEQHSTCSKCTHSWQKDEKKYIYGIKHLYGLVGSMRNYSPRSCKFLQGKNVSCIEEGGCPFTHFDDQHLRELLKSVLPEESDEIEVIIHQRKRNPNISCKRLYGKVYKQLVNTDPQNDQYDSPVQYYFLLKDGFSNKKTEL